MVCKFVGYGMFDMTVCMVIMMGMEYVLFKVGMVCMFGIVCMLLYIW